MVMQLQLLLKGKVMNKAKKSFISSTFWSERIGFSAGIATISYMIKNKTWEKLINSGKYLNSKWRELSSKYELPIEISGISQLHNLDLITKIIII